MLDTPDEVEPRGPTGARRRPKARYVVVAIVCTGAVAWMLVGGLAKNLVYLKPVSDAVEEREDTGNKRFRMGGTVAPGSIVETAGGVSFEVVEGGVTAEVDHSGDPPDLFEECVPVVVEGRWEGELFRSDRLLVKHGEEYSPESKDLVDCAQQPSDSQGSTVGSVEGSTGTSK